MEIPLWRLDWPRLGRPFCNVYVIAAEGRWPVKIGVAVCAAKRLKQLQTSHWKPLEVSRAWWCEGSTAAFAVERRVHDLLDDERRKLLGEWYDRSVEQADEVVRFAAAVEGVELNEHIPEDVVPKLGAMVAAMKKAESKRRWNESLAIAERVEAAYSIDATR
jgi:hypothetical protein